MPQHGVNAHFSVEELKEIQNAATKLGISKYKLMRDAVLKYCEECLKNAGIDKRGRNISGKNEQDIRDSASAGQREAEPETRSVLARILRE